MRARHLTIPSLLAALPFLANAATPASAAIFRVGAAGDPACSSTNIVSALLSAAFTPEADEIRLANNQTYTNQRIATGGQALTIRGGYANCAATLASSSGTTLDGSGGAAGPVMTIDNTGGSTRPRLDLDNLTLTGGEQAGLRILGNVDVVLNNTRVQFNGPARGIEIRDNAVVTLRVGSMVDNNGMSGTPGIFGGGILCDRARVDLEDAHIFNNLAFGGGGIYGTNGCQIDLARTVDILFGSPGGIFQNEAQVGGGLYLDGGADLHAQPYLGQTIIHDNQAVNGGGLYLTGAGTTGQLHDTVIEDNVASLRGGGAYVTVNAALLMDRGAAEWLCPVGARCSQLVRNRVTSTSLDGGGGGLFVTDAATATLRQTIVEANRFDFGAAGWVDGGGEIDLESSVVAKNVGDNAFQVMDGTLELKFVSTTSNGVSDPRISTSVYDMGADGAQVHVFSSVIDDQALGGCLGSCSTHTMDCVVSPVTNIYPGIITRYHQLSPRFRDVARGNYHLRPDSPAIDLCDASLAAPTPGVGDVDRNTRPVDLASIANEDGPHDAGADEVTATELLTIFSDGFELRNTAAWSGTAP